MTKKRKDTALLSLAIILLFAVTNIVTAATDIEGQINNLLEEGEIIRSDNPQKALEIAFNALHLSDSIKNNKFIGLSKKSVGVTYVRMYLYKKAIPYLSESLQLLQNYNLNEDIGIVHLNLGRAYRENDAYILAEKSLKECISTASSLSDTTLLGQAYYMLTKVYRKKSDFVSGLDACLKCLEIANSTNNESLQAGCENEMGYVFLNQGNIDDALRYYNYALQKKLVVNDSSGIADTYISIGNVYSRSDKNFKAIEFYQKASSYIPKTKYQPNVFNIPYNMGIAYYNLNQYVRAKMYFLDAMNIARTQNSQSNVASAKIWMGTLLLEEKDYNGSQKNLKEALQIAGDIGSLDVEKNVYLGFYRYYEKIEEYRQALDYYKKYTETLNKILNNENIRTLDEMRLIYESERQAHDINELQNKVLKQELDNAQLKSSRNRWFFIALLAVVIIITGVFIVFEKRKGSRILAEKNKELQDAVRRLEESIQTKDKLFSIIAHDLSNPFNSILGFAELLIVNRNSLTQEQIKKYGSNIHSSAKKAYNLLQNLLSWSRLQLGKFVINQVETQLMPLVEREVANCQEIAQNKNITIANYIDPSINVRVDVSMLSIVLRNLITNAIKFSPFDSNVILKSSIDGEYIDIVVSDSGIGIPKEKLGKLFSFRTNTSTTGTDGEKGTGLGLVLSYELIKLNKGNIRVESKPGKTDFTVSLPL